MPDVIIVGAGPVGLLMARLLAAQGVAVTIIERASLDTIRSRAIGITPPSLAILEEAGLAKEFAASGVSVRCAVVHNRVRVAGRLDLSSARTEYPFVLALPQSRTMELLSSDLGANVNVVRGCSFENYRENPDCVEVHLSNGRTADCRILIGCDGHHSDVRQSAGIGTKSKSSPLEFVMGDFDETTDWASEAHLFFTDGGSVESFPLPNKRRRWIVRTRPSSPADQSYLRSEVLRLAGENLSSADIHWVSSFRIQQTMARSYGCGRVALCGDACHAFSPIGGQGMNTGFADAAFLARQLPPALSSNSFAGLWDLYWRCRAPAGRLSARRAWAWVWFGSRRGRILSAVRDVALAAALHSPLRAKMAKDFLMLNLPGNRIVTRSPAATWSPAASL